MQKPFAYSPVHRTARNFSLTRTQISIIAFVVAILVFMIGCALLNERYRSSDSAARSSLSLSSELSTGMPLP